VNEQQAFVHARPSFVAEDVLANGRNGGVRLPDGSLWGVHLSLNVGLE
jgi:hypothetical protein